MIVRSLKILAVLLVLIGATAFAQEREAPQTRQQVMLSYAPLVKSISPAVVNIYTKRIVTRSVNPFGNDPFFKEFFGRGLNGGLSRKDVESSLGSGLIVDPSGVVITNAHVVKEAQEISIVLSDGREFDAKVSLADAPSDLAVLRITDANGEALPYARLTPSEQLEVGDIVIAIGNPFGVGQTVTSGIVSALARSSLNINDFNFFIQTDAAINPGNSGGPLVAMDGGVVGINTAIFSRSGGSLGIGFAIPSEMVATVIAAEKSGGENSRVVRPWLGLSAQQVTADIANSLDLNRPAGILVTKLNKSSPARKAGLEVGDIITSVNGKNVRDVAEMKFRLATVPLGQESIFEVLRKGKAKRYTVLAVAPPEEPARNETVLDGLHPLNGAKAVNINPAVAVELGLDADREGVAVLSVARGSRAARLVKAGDIITSVNENDVKDVKNLQDELEQAARQGAFSIVLDRGGQRAQIVIR